MRYVTKSGLVYGGDEVSVTADVVIVSDDGVERTGLVDSAGTPLFRVRDKLPIGFHGAGTKFGS